MFRLGLPAIGLALLVSSAAWADLRTYDVDPQYRDEILSALGDILTPDPSRGLIMEAHGRVELLPSGQILVNASAETLDQVERVLQAIRSRPAAPAPRAALRYWAVLGTRASADAADQVGSAPPPLLNDVLSELRGIHGDVTFRVMGTAAIATESGQRGEVGGTTLRVEQTAHVQGNTLNAEISMRLVGNARPPLIGIVEIGNLDLRTTLQRGDFVVLGESHYQSIGLDGPVFFIVHWAEE